MHRELLALQDDAWDLKDLCDDLAPRKLSGADVAQLESVRRDLARLTGKVVGIRDKRKRAAADGAEPTTEDDSAPDEPADEQHNTAEEPEHATSN